MQILLEITEKTKAFRNDLNVDFGLYNFWLMQYRNAKEGHFNNLAIRNNSTGVDLDRLSGIKGARILRRVSPGYDRYRLAYRDDPSGYMTYRWAFENPLLDKYARGAFFYHKYWEYRYRGEDRDLFKDFEQSGPIASYILYRDRYTLRPWVRQVATIDPATLVFGGFGLLTAGREDLIEEFARNFTPLPVDKFVKRFGSIQPVTYRELKKDGKTYFYLVNDTFISLQVKVEFKNRQKVYSNNDSAFISPETAEGRHYITFSMPPYSLRSFEGAANLNVSAVLLSPSHEDIEALKQRVIKVKKFFANSKNRSVRRLLHDLFEAYQEKRYRDTILLLEHPLIWVQQREVR